MDRVRDRVRNRVKDRDMGRVRDRVRLNLTLKIEKVQMRATKLLSSTRNLKYEERLKILNLPTLKYHRVRGDMIELYKIITCKQDHAVTLKFNTIPAPVTRGNTYKIRQDHVRYDLRKISFSNRVRMLWNSLPDIVVKAESVNSFKTRLDRFWDDQELKFNWKADIKGTGSRSNLM